MKTLILTAIMTLIPIASFAEEVPGQQLLSYFSANCRTQGEWTRSALADSTALIEALRGISNDPDCKSVAGAMSQLNLLNQQLSNLEKVNETQVKLAEYEAQEQQLLIQLAGTTNPSDLSTLNTNLRQLQVQRAGLVARDRAQTELAGPSKADALISVVQLANSTFAQVSGNQRCLQKNPSLLNTATSIMAAVGSATAAVNPAIGLGLTAGASFLGATVEGVRNAYTARAIRKIADNSIAVEGYKCALETMAERWCQMRDAESFLLFKAQQRQNPRLNSGLGVAIRLNDREAPVLLEWLNKIRSGVTPTTTADAERQTAVFRRETFVRSQEAFGLGFIEENRKIYNTYTNLDERWVFLRSVTRAITPGTETPFRNPFYDVISVGYTPFFILGLPDDASIRNERGDYFTLDVWKKPEGFNPTLDTVKSRYVELIQRARNRVNQELSQVLQPDALQTLSSAYDRSGNRWKIAPMDALQRIIEFLDTHPPRESDMAFKKLYTNTLEKLKEIYKVTQEAIIQTATIDSDSNIASVERIYEIAQLRYGTVVVEARLDMMIRLALLELLETSPQEDQILVAQLLAAERFTETISKMSGTDNLALIRADINRAQPITISNLNSFMDTFGDNVKRILAKLVREEQASSGSIARSKRYARTELCFLLLAVPELDRYVDARLCQGLKLGAVISGGPESITIKPETFVLDMNERACEYRDFFRRSKIFETWGVK